ncbi:MAG: hypothetical protein GKR94_12560 [Gammaproteobacteria bacterium]|nr:hypothetical protein [Gammaproteobacteria bacterium]
MTGTTFRWFPEAVSPLERTSASSASEAMSPTGIEERYRQQRQRSANAPH